MTKVMYVAASNHSKQKSKQKKDGKTSFVSKDTKTSSAYQTTAGKIPEVRIHLGFWPRLSLYILGAILVYLIIQIFVPLLNFQIYIQWWNKNGGKKYKNVFSITQFAYYGSFRLYGIIGSLMSSGLTTIQNKSQYLFILSCITTWGKFDASDKTGFLLPVHLCESIVVGDDYPTTTDGWKDQLAKWGVPSDYVSTGELINHLDPKLWDVDRNFLLKKYGIFQDSPFILGFATGASADLSNNKLYPTAFLTAVGIDYKVGIQSSSYGGWWGFINTGLGTETPALGEIYRQLYSLEASQLPLTPTPKCSVSGEIGSILGTAASFSMAGAGIGQAPGAVIGGLAGLVVGLTTSGIKAGTKKCKGAGA